MSRGRGRPPKKKKDNDSPGPLEQKLIEENIDAAIATAVVRGSDIIVGVDTAIGQDFSTSATFERAETGEIKAIEDDNDPSDPLQLAASILGCDRMAFVIAGDKRLSTPNEFFYYQYGVGLSFKQDEKSGLFEVLNHRSKHTCNAASYWLIDKLIAETRDIGGLFFSPGREGIVR